MSDSSRAIRSKLVTGARELGLDLSLAEVASFTLFQAELLDWNRRINLTAIVEPEEIEVKHFLDSFTLLAAIPNPVGPAGEKLKLLDVGTGAGVPGIPLAIARPNLDVSLLEATRKKCRFLEHVRDTLSLANVAIMCGRAEEIAHQPRHRETYDVVVARAVAPLSVLAELCLPFARPGGRFIAMKKIDIGLEIAEAAPAFRVLGGRIASQSAVDIPYLNEARQLIVVEKIARSPREYPRRPGVPAKAPLGTER